MRSMTSPVTPSPGCSATLALSWSHRITPSISLHHFVVTSQHELNVQPCQHVTFQFAEDFDPMLGTKGLAREHRRFSFTPADISFTDEELVKTVTLLSTNGRVSGLMGLPRPNGPLLADLVEVGGGFSRDAILRLNRHTLCVAGGTGVACFLALASSRRRRVGLGGGLPAPVLYWSIRQDDIRMVEHLCESGILSPHDWSSLHIFVTTGAAVGYSNASPVAVAIEKKLRSDAGVPNGTSVSARRMTQEDINQAVTGQSTDVFFCGSKSLEWQVKMWCLDTATVHCTAPS